MHNKILVLGGLGFIGKSVVNKLTNKGFSVTILTKFHADAEGCFHGCSVIKSDFSYEHFKKVLSLHFDKVLMLSGNPHPSFSQNDPVIDIELGVIPLINLLKALENTGFCGDFWYGSSVAVYGSHNEPVLKESFVPQPISPYGIGKLVAENYCQYYGDVKGLSVGVLRIFSTYGSCLKRQVIYDLYLKMKNNDKDVHLLSPKGDARDLSHVEDVSSAIALVIDSKPNPQNEVINIGSGVATEIEDVALMIKKQIGFKANVFCAENRRDIDGSSWCADISKISSLGFKVEYDLHKGIAEIVGQWENDN